MTDRSSDTRLTDDFNPLMTETFFNAHDDYKELRAKCPVAHSNAYGGYWGLFTYEDVVHVLQNPDVFVTSVQNVVPKVATTGRRPPLHLDPPDHTPYRLTLNPFLTEEKVAALETHIRPIVVELLQPFIEQGGGDICAEFSHKLPGHVFARFFNLSPTLSMSIREVTKNYVQALHQVDNVRVQQMSLELYDIAREIIESRKREPMDPERDVTSAYLFNTWNGEHLPEDMVLGTIRQLIVVGMIAPVIFIGSVAVHLSRHPEIQNMLRGDLSLIPAAIEEYLRLFTPYRGFARTAKQDVVLRDRLIKKDEPIAVVFASANRDESVFPNSEQFILHRPNISEHVAFGMGPHRCPGAPLARMMLSITLEELLKRTVDVELDGDVQMSRWPEWGPQFVPVKTTPR